MKRTGWDIGYRNGWDMVTTDRDLDVEETVRIIVERETESGIRHTLFPPDGSAGCTMDEALIVCGIRDESTVEYRAPLSSPGWENAWNDGPGSA